MRINWTSIRGFALVAMLMAAGCSDGLDPDDWVNDTTGRLTDDQRTRLAQYHDALLDNRGIDYRVVVTDADEAINRQANRLFRELGAGSRSDRGRGLVLVLNTASDEVRLEVSEALEGHFPDGFIAYLEHRQMVPYFRDDRVVDGILAATEMIVTRARNAAMDAGVDGEAWAAHSGGAGARADAELGQGRDERFREGGRVTPGGSPRETLAAYIAAMEERNARPDLPIYTAETREMLKEWTVTPAQMDNVVRSHRECTGDTVRRHGHYPLAVIRYPIDARRCSPYFFRREDGAWRLDLTVMRDFVRFGPDNRWRLSWQGRNPYEFAFADWCFSDSGVPLEPCELRWGVYLSTYGRDTYVVWVADDSAAARMGLRPGDRVAEWNGNGVHHSRHLSGLMGDARPGAEVRARVERDGAVMTIQGEAPPRP